MALLYWARTVVSPGELGVVNSYTLEASFCGADFGPLGEQHFTTRHLEEMGYMVRWAGETERILTFHPQGLRMIGAKLTFGMYHIICNSIVFWVCI